MRVVTANVNGFRAAVRRGALPWLEAAQPDVVALQETRCTPAEFAKALEGSGLAEFTRYLAEGPSAGRAGVAVLVRPGLAVSESVTTLESAAPAEAPEPGADGAVNEAEAAGRWLEVGVETPQGLVTVISAYIHSGDETKPELQARKYALLDAVTARLRRAREEGEQLALTGDLNVAHREADLKNWKGNIGKAGFLAEERAYFDGW